MFGRLLLTAVLATTMASAQRGGGGGGMGGGDDTGGMGGAGGMDGAGGMGGGIPRVQRQTKAEMLADRLKLNKDQKQELETIFTAAMKEAAPLREQLLKGRDVITGAIIAGRSQDDLKKLFDAYAILSAQMIGIETKAFTKLCATLKPNQQSKTASAFELMAGMFDPPATGGRMGGGRMGGGGMPGGSGGKRGRG